MVRRRDHQVIIGLLVAAALLLSAGCRPEAGAVAYKISVTKAGAVLKDLTVDEIEALPKVDLTADGKTQNGPRLMEVLKAAGVSDFASVTVTGAWKETLTLSKEEVTDEVILDFANRGTCKLTGSKIPKDKWVRDVMTVEVK